MKNPTFVATALVTLGTIACLVPLRFLCAAKIRKDQPYLLP